MASFGASFSSMQAPLFTGKNYEYWLLTMKALLRAQDVWEITEEWLYKTYRFSNI